MLNGTGTLVAVLVAAMTAGSCCAAEPDPWAGTYNYSHGAGRNAAGTGVVVDYRLRLGPAGCLFTAEGYQTDEAIRCSATASADRIDIGFESYSDGAPANAFGTVVYRRGDTLFSLERRGGRLLTRWHGYLLPDGKPPRLAVSFVRDR